MSFCPRIHLVPKIVDGRSMLRRDHDADRIADDYFTVAPLATGVSGMTMASRPSVSDAASIIP